MTRQSSLHVQYHPSHCRCRNCKPPFQQVDPADGIRAWLPGPRTSIAMIIIAVAGIAINLALFL